jgi:CHAT domain-containing protein/Flp pilus assembly protein TadD
MRYRRIGLTAFVNFLATILSVDLGLPVLNRYFSQNSQVLAQSSEARKAEADRLNEQGIQQFQTSQFEAALQSWQKALVICQEIKDRQCEGVALGNLGSAYKNLGDYAKAIEYQQQRLAIARENKDRLGEGKSLGNLGLAYYNLGDYAKAIEYHQQSLAIARENKDRLGEGQSLGNLGLAYYNLGDYAKAIEYHQQSLAIAREIKDRNGEGNALGNLGNAYYSLGDYAKAIEYQQQRLAIAREIKDRNGEGNALGSLGLAYDALGDYAKAIEYQQQRLVIAREIKYRKGEGNALGNLGNAYSSLGDYAKAIEYQEQSLAIKREIKDRNGEGTALGNLGLAYSSLGDYAKAIDYYQQSLTIAREIKDRNGEGTALNNLGAALFKSGNLIEAEKTLRTGIELWESQRTRLGNNDAYKISIFEGQASTYRLLQKVLIAQNKTNDALEVSERGRARAFVELLTTRLSPVEGQLQKVDPPTIEQIKQIAKVQNFTLVQYSIIYDDFKVQGKEQTQESKLYIWVIKPTGEVNFRNVDLTPLWQKQDTSLSDLVTNARESIGVSRSLLVVGPDPEGVKNAEAQATKRLQQLHQLLIEPIANLLPTDPNAHVTFIPQASLFLAPFPALQDASGKYLIEQHTILTAPSIQVLDLTHKQRQQQVGAYSRTPLQGNDALVVGNPTMPSIVTTIGEKPQQLRALPGAEREAKAIAPLLNTQPLIGNQATKTVVEQLMPKARIIHLATHGLLDNVQGLQSAIALAPDASSLTKGGGQDRVNGLLTAAEIFSLKLNAELVVLSACDTGRGKLVGDGVIGLSRSLISAGTSSVMVSLWAVSDDSTAYLMTEFYKNIQHNSNKAQALRQAMLSTMKKGEYSNPRQWAAFTLIGEAE